MLVKLPEASCSLSFTQLDLKKIAIMYPWITMHKLIQFSPTGLLKKA